MLKTDEALGSLMRQLRKSSRMSQMQLAERIGVSYQQVQKYEKGVNRLSVSRLKQVSDALGLDISVFIEEINRPTAAEPQAKYTGLSNEEGKLLMLFRRIRSKKLRTDLIEMIDSAVKAIEKK